MRLEVNHKFSLMLVAARSRLPDVREARYTFNSGGIAKRDKLVKLV
jgi:hypothetical protein